MAANLGALNTHIHNIQSILEPAQVKFNYNIRVCNDPPHNFETARVPDLRHKKYRRQAAKNYNALNCVFVPSVPLTGVSVIMTTLHVYTGSYPQ